MDSAIQATLSSIRSTSPDIKLYTPDSADYESLRKTYIVSPAKPFAIARPQSAEHVQALVKACVANGVEFSVRTGGHGCATLTLVDNSLTIDMRDIKYVEVSEDKKTAKVGGGALLGGVLTALGEHGLATPCGSIASVGYVGWASLGGYGPFTSVHGLGVDQILGAKVVNSKGDLITAEEDLLTGIRGAGPLFGPIVEVTIKVYPLKELLVGTLVFDSSDMKGMWSKLANAIQTINMPDVMRVQPFSMDFPGAGKVLAAIVTWVSDDHEEGHKWIEKIASLGTCVMNMTAAKTAAKYAEDNEQIAPYGVNGQSYSLSIKDYTPETVDVLAEYSNKVPGGGCMMSLHSLPSPKENTQSVFGAREVHHVLEVVAMTADPSLKSEAMQWGQAVTEELQKRDPSNVLDIAYVSLKVAKDADLTKIYNKHLPTLEGLKKKYDPGNVFKNATPAWPVK